MAKSAPQPQLLNSIFQVRFIPFLRFNTITPQIEDRLENYPNWGTDGLTVNFWNPDNYSSLVLNNGNCTYSQHSADEKLERNSVEQLLKLLKDQYEIQHADFVGYRCRYAIPAEMSLHELISVMHVKLLSQDPAVRKILGTKDNSQCILNFDTRDGGILRRFVIGGFLHATMATVLNLSKEAYFEGEDHAKARHSYLNRLPNLAVYVDIDTLRQETAIQAQPRLPLADTFTFFEKAHVSAIATARGLSDYIFSTTIAAEAVPASVVKTSESE